MICGSFLGKVIALHGKEKYAIQLTYLYIILLTVYLAFCAISGFLGGELGATCVRAPQTSWHWQSLTIVDTVQAILIVVLTLLIWQKSKPQSQDKSVLTID